MIERMRSKMKEFTIEAFEDLLINFVKRASSPKASKEEIEALPGVASVLCRLLISFESMPSTD